MGLYIFSTPTNTYRLALAPAEDVVSYKIVTFGKYFGFDNRSPYTQSPSPELEAMWEDLYNGRFSMA